MGIESSKNHLQVIGEKLEPDPNEILIRARSFEQLIDVCADLSVRGVKTTAVSNDDGKALIWIESSAAAKTALCDKSCMIETLPCHATKKGTHRFVVHGATHLALLQKKQELEAEGYRVTATSSPADLSNKKALFLSFE